MRQATSAMVPLQSRSDFTYTSQTESSLQLTNANHLAEFILNVYAKKTGRDVLSLRLNDQIKLEIIKLRDLMDSTYYAAMERGIMPAKLFEIV